ncbi:hypothetical protein RhiirC2_783024 [Rhizophagus irregularis]|uniref:Uncharacterized protein n=1 Tax=Rhizophagus irregularis TaxID=588596 RepID=A0A2N1N1T1_9GLOM|nr:hypothetical protein RhiirC2_783024 [Rhizophagus irregularis]
MSALATESNFSYVPYEKLSFGHFTSWVSNNFGQTENDNGIFYNILYIIRDDLSASVKVRDTVNRLINRKNDKRNIHSATREFITNITGKERSKKKKNKLEKVIQKLENIENLVKGLQKSKVDISKIKYSEWEKIRMSTGLKFEAIDLKLKQETKNNAFQWDDRTEREQKDRYLPHLRKLLQISKYRKLEIYDTTNNNNFLSIRDDTLQIKLIGTTDAALKKSISDGNLYQALAELTARDLKSIHAVLAVLTDLRDDWQFFYFDDEIIGTFTLPRSKAVALI